MSGNITGKRGELNVPGKRKVVSRNLSLRKEQIDMLKSVSKFSGKSISNIVTDLLQNEREKRENGKEKNIGASLRSIRTETTKSALDKRFLSMLSAKTFDALVYHLWQITKLAKAKGANPVDFARLANDLFWYQRGRAQEIRLQWASSYYRYGDDNEDDAMLENNGRKNA